MDGLHYRLCHCREIRSDSWSEGKRSEVGVVGGLRTIGDGGLGFLTCRDVAFLQL
jgi:hypothetical protein